MTINDGKQPPELRNSENSTMANLIENLASILVLRITSWILSESFRYLNRKADIEGRLAHWIRSLGPEASDVQGMLDDYLSYKKKWEEQNMSNLEILLRSLRCWANILEGLIKLTFQSFVPNPSQDEESKDRDA